MSAEIETPDVLPKRESDNETKQEKSNLSIETPKQPDLAKHDATILDLAFVMDCTGSMGSYIASATNSIRQIVEDIVALEKSDIKLALVEYRDHPPQDETFVTRVHDFTESVKETKKWLENCSAEGGGDAPEAVADGLHEALKLGWRENSTKICVLISDAPPHGLGGSGDSFPNGCPNGIDPLDVVRKMAQKGITLYSVGCEPAIVPYKEFFTAIAYTTGGQYVPLRNANLLSKVIVGGAVEEISLEKLLAEAEKEVENQRALGVTDEHLLTEAVEKSLKMRGVKTRQMKLNDSNLERASESAIKYSKLSSMAELRKEYKPAEGSFPSYGAPDGMMSYALASPRLMSCAAPPRRTRRHDVDSDHMLVPTAMESPIALEAVAPEALLDVGSSASSHIVREENYTVADDEINYQQSERLVQKILNRKK